MVYCLSDHQARNLLLSPKTATFHWHESGSIISQCRINVYHLLECTRINEHNEFSNVPGHYFRFQGWHLLDALIAGTQTHVKRRHTSPAYRCRSQKKKDAHISLVHLNISVKLHSFIQGTNCTTYTCRVKTLSCHVLLLTTSLHSRLRRGPTSQQYSLHKAILSLYAIP